MAFFLPLYTTRVDLKVFLVNLEVFRLGSVVCRQKEEE